MGVGEVQSTVLQNGVSLHCTQGESTTGIRVQVWVGCGAADTKDGTAHLCEHLICHGREPGQRSLAETVHLMDGRLDAWTGHDETVFEAVSPRKNLANVLEALARRIRSLKFSEEELKAERDAVLSESEAREQRVLATRGVFASAFAGHGYSHSCAGEPAAIPNISRKKILDFYEGFYRGPNIAVVCFAPPDFFAEFNEMAARVFGHGLATVGAISKRRRLPSQKGPGLRVRWQGRSSSFVVLGFRVPSILRESSALASQFASVLGSSESGLLRDIQRHSFGIESVGATVCLLRASGLLLVSAKIRNGMVLTGIGAIAKTIAGARKDFKDGHPTIGRKDWKVRHRIFQSLWSEVSADRLQNWEKLRFAEDTFRGSNMTISAVLGPRDAPSVDRLVPQALSGFDECEGALAS